MREKAICPQCGGEYVDLGVHWAKSSTCNHPEYPAEVKDVLVALSKTVGGVKDTVKLRYPKYTVQNKNADAIIEMYKFMGVFASKPDSYNLERSFEEFDGAGAKEPTKTREFQVTKLRLRPHPHLKLVINNHRIQNKNLGLKVLHHFKDGRDRNRCECILKAKKTHLWWANYLTNMDIDVEIDKNEQISAPREQIEEHLIDWPTGWWNERYMD